MALSTINSRSIAAGALRDSDLGTLDTLTVSGNATFDTSTLVVDAVNNRVGVGTASPASYGRLAVMTPTDTFGYFGIGNSVGGGGGVNIGSFYGTTKISYIDTVLENGTPSSEQSRLQFATIAGGTLTERMRIDSSGNVNIGSAADAGNALRYFDIYNTNTGATAGSIIRLITSNAAGSGTTTGELIKYKSGLLALVNNEPSATANTAFWVAGAERMRIDSSGNVGIGCTPDSALEIRTATNSSSDTTYLKLSNLGENVGHIDFENGNGNLARITGTKLGSGASANDGILTFSTAFDAVLSERMRITSSGNVGIGTTNPGELLHLSLPSGTNGDIVRLSRSAGAYSFQLGVSSGATSNLYISDNSNNNIIDFTSSGNVGIGGSETTVFNGVGGDMKFVVIGDDSTTTIANNSDAGIAIVNTNQTAGNLAGLHFARADTDDNPNYAGASIVAQFLETQVTGQYPKGDLAFLTSTAANNAPSEKMRIKADGTFNYNGLKIFAKSFYGSNNISYSFDIPVGDEGGGGQNMLVLATHAHYYNFAYGCGYYAILGRRQASPGTQARVIDSWSNANGGSWSISNPNNSTMRLTKNAGTYGGGGWGIVYVIYPHGT